MLDIRLQHQRIRLVVARPYGAVGEHQFDELSHDVRLHAAAGGFLSAVVKREESSPNDENETYLHQSRSKANRLRRQTGLHVNVGERRVVSASAVFGLIIFFIS